jgi:hypothetical protein
MAFVYLPLRHRHMYALLSVCCSSFPTRIVPDRLFGGLYTHIGFRTIHSPEYLVTLSPVFRTHIGQGGGGGSSDCTHLLGLRAARDGRAPDVHDWGWGSDADGSEAEAGGEGDTGEEYGPHDSPSVHQRCVEARHREAERHADLVEVRGTHHRSNLHTTLTRVGTCLTLESTSPH